MAESYYKENGVWWGGVGSWQEEAWTMWVFTTLLILENMWKIACRVIFK